MEVIVRPSFQLMTNVAVSFGCELFLMRIDENKMKSNRAKWRRDPVAFITEVLVDPETGKPFQLYPDQEAFKKEEQRRFEILDAHWDLPIKDVQLDKR